MDICDALGDGQEYGRDGRVYAASHVARNESERKTDTHSGMLGVYSVYSFSLLLFWFPLVASVFTTIFAHEQRPCHHIGGAVGGALGGTASVLAEPPMAVVALSSPDDTVLPTVSEMWYLCKYVRCRERRTNHDQSH